MRRGWRLAVVLVALGALGWLASRILAQSPGAETRGPTRISGTAADGLPRAPSRPLAPASRESSQSIRGSVKGPHGSVAGATILASRAVPGESLSALPCEGSFGEDERLSVLTCQEPERLRELVARRHGEVPVLARATSAEDGSFALEGLEAGAYALWAESPEGTGLWQDVRAGQQGVELRLGAGVRLSGVVTGEETGPLPGALVTAIFTAHSRFFEAVTDDTGHFALGPLPRGEYVVLVSKDGWLSTQQSLTAYAARTERKVDLDRPRRVSGRVTREGVPVEGARVSTEAYRMSPRTVFTDATGHFSLEGLSPWESYSLTATHQGLGARAWVSFQGPKTVRSKPLVEYPEVFLELTPVTEVRGHVFDDARRPLAHATVSLFEQVNDVPSFVASTQTDAEGRYVLGPAKPGPLHLEARAPGWFFPEDPWTDLPMGTTTRDLVLSRVSVVAGLLVDTEGQPVPHASMRLTGPEPLDEFAGESGPDGRFHLDVWRPGSYQLEFDDKLIRDGDQEVVAPANLRLVVKLRPEVVGEVVDETGAPVPNVEVTLGSDDSQGGGARFASGSTDARGRFALPTPGPGHYRVSAEFQQEDVLHSASREVEVATGKTSVQLRFEPGHELTGVVVDKRGQPLEGVRVLLHSSRHASPLGHGAPVGGVLTGPEGRFTFQAVTGESLELSVGQEGLRPRQQVSDEPRDTLRLEPGARDVRVVLIHEARVRGRLVWPDGSPVVLYRVNGHPLASASGALSWPILGTGTLQLEFSAPEQPEAPPVRRLVSVQEEVDQDLGTIVLGSP